MKNIGFLLSYAATLALIVPLTATAVPAQQRGTSAQRAQNTRAVADLRTRIADTERHIADGRRSNTITPARAATLRRQTAQMRAEMTRLSHKQGFLSAAEMASYTRVLAATNAELDRRGAGYRPTNAVPVANQRDDRPDGLQYDCQNEPVAIAIPGQKLDDALAALRLVTRCPISGTRLAQGKRSRPLVGTMTPGEAMQAVLNGTGLQVRSIRGGFQVIPLPRR